MEADWRWSNVPALESVRVQPGERQSYPHRKVQGHGTYRDKVTLIEHIGKVTHPTYIYFDACNIITGT